MKNQQVINFYNTVNLTPDEVNERLEKIPTQVKKILFLMSDGQKRTSTQIHLRLGINLNSCRRAICDMVYSEPPLMEMLEETVFESYGAPNHLYVITPAGNDDSNWT